MRKCLFYCNSVKWPLNCEASRLQWDHRSDCEPIGTYKLLFSSEVFVSRVLSLPCPCTVFFLSCWWPLVHTWTEVWALKLSTCHTVLFVLQSVWHKLDLFQPDSLEVSSIIPAVLGRLTMASIPQSKYKQNLESNTDKASTLCLFIYFYNLFLSYVVTEHVNASHF